MNKPRGILLNMLQGCGNCKKKKKKKKKKKNASFKTCLKNMLPHI